MTDPKSEMEAAKNAAERWSKSDKSETLKFQILATFRLQKAWANSLPNVYDSPGMRLTAVKKLWADAFRDQQDFTHKFEADEEQGL